MSSLALARKYRPQGFEAVVGQETTVRILKNALTQKRLHHAYLFTGPRGIGKTTLARIFAKALNCQKTSDPSAEPCNECDSCKEITEGRSLSVQEIDGASNTSVEDVRDLREKIRYLPTGGRYKIYIIDEVHMLSTAAFNALLKTLEEPPAHAIFLFATTDAQKMPATVISRVIRFDLRPISRAAIVQQLKKILSSENVVAEDDALFLIAREAEGGLRDALSLLDQVISFSGGKVTLPGVEEIVGVSTRGFIRDFIKAVMEKDGGKALQVCESAFQAGLDAKRLSMDLLEAFRHLLVAQVSRDPALFDLSQEEVDELAVLAKSVPPATLDRLFRMTQKGVTDLLRAPLPRVVFDVLALRLAQAEDLAPLEDILAALRGSAVSAGPSAGPATAGPMTAAPAPRPQSAPPPATAQAPSQRIESRPPPPAAEAPTGDKNWNGFLAYLKTKSVRLSSMLEQGSLISLGEAEARIRFPTKSSMTVELLKEPERDGAFSAALKDYFGKTIKPVYESAGTPASPGSGSLIDDAISIFGPADVIPREEIVTAHKNPLERLVNALSRLPGIGEKSATRLALFILRDAKGLSGDLMEALAYVREKVRFCRDCQNLSEEELCPICSDPQRDRTRLCVVQEPVDLMMVERTGEYRGLYHVLHGAISPLDGIGPEDIRGAASLLKRAAEEGVAEIILATNPNPEGEATALFLKKAIAEKSPSLSVTRIASGVPVGGSVEYTDAKTLARALSNRQNY